MTLEGPSADPWAPSESFLTPSPFWASYFQQTRTNKPTIRRHQTKLRLTTHHRGHTIEKKLNQTYQIKELLLLRCCLFLCGSTPQGSIMELELGKRNRAKGIQVNEPPLQLQVCVLALFIQRYRNWPKRADKWKRTASNQMPISIHYQWLLMTHELGIIPLSFVT
jgi:hypothetical protein